MIMLMKLNFKYSDVMERCRMLSSYEGRDHMNEGGDSLYLEVKITEQDEPLLLTYMGQAAHMLQEQMNRMITGSEYTDKGFVWDIRAEETRWNPNKKFDDNLHEALVSYVMMNWLSEKKSSRTELYKTLWEDMSKMCVQNIYRKMSPTKKRRAPVIDTDEVEVFTK